MPITKTNFPHKIIEKKGTLKKVICRNTTNMMFKI
jgi:hypothetical protein